MAREPFKANIEQSQRDAFEKNGFLKVKDMAQQWPHPLSASAYEWLREREDEEAIKAEDSMVEQIRIARTAKNAAIIAAIAAIIAIPIAVAAMIVSFLAWRNPHG